MTDSSRSPFLTQGRQDTRDRKCGKLLSFSRSHPLSFFVFLAAVLAFIVIALLPTVVMLVTSVELPSEGGKGLSFVRTFLLSQVHRYHDVFSSPGQLNMVKNSLLLAAMVTVLSVTLGTASGFLLGRTDLPFKGAFRFGLIVPLVIPPYINGIGWTNLFRKNGWLSTSLHEVLGLPCETLSNFIYSIAGCTFLMTLACFPLIMLIVEQALRTMDTSVEEAALLEGGRWQVAGRISLPLVLPHILSGALIVFVLGISEFGAPSLLLVKVFTFEIFTQISAFADFKAATVLSLPLLFIALAAMLVERAFLRERSFELLESQGMAEPKTVALRRFKFPALIYLGLLLTLAFIVPAAVLLQGSFNLEAYRKALALSMRPVMNTLLFSAAGATAVTVLGLILGYVVAKSKSSFARLLDAAIVLAFAVPNVVFGLGLVKLWNRPLGVFDFIYGSACIMLFGYIGRFLILSSRIMAASVQKLPPSIEEAAAIDGASFFHCITKILLPLLTPAVLASWLISFIFCAGELGTTIMVYPPNHDTLPIAIYTVMANSPTDIVSAMCVILVVIVLAPLVFCEFLGLFRYRTK